VNRRYGIWRIFIQICGCTVCLNSVLLLNIVSKTFVLDLSNQMEVSTNVARNKANVGENFEVKAEEWKVDRESAVMDNGVESQYLDDQTSGSTRKRRGVVYRSPAWKYFTETKKGAECKLCGRLLKNRGGTTSTMFQHLKSMHRKQHAVVMEECGRRKMEAASRHLVSVLTCVTSFINYALNHYLGRV